MPATLVAASSIGTAGVTWGLTAETGILLQRTNAKTTREKNSVRDQNGDIVLNSYYNPVQTISLEGVTKATTGGVVSATPGVLLSLANTFPNNGVNAGGIYTDDVDVARLNTDFQKITVNATRYPLIA